MNIRVKFSVGLIGLGLILALLPLPGNRTLTVKPKKLLAQALHSESYFTVDQVARLVVSEDSTFQLIDLRTREEFLAYNIPGSINIPYNELLKKDPGGFLNNKKTKNIFYSNGGLNSGYAFILTRGMNYQNTFAMKGGLNEWFNTVMNSTFTGDKISARENALFETRTAARKLFTEINNLPDSLKMKYMETRLSAAKKLDGGCE